MDVPTLETESNTITLRGPQEKLGQALTQVWLSHFNTHSFTHTHSLIHPYSFTHSLIHPYSFTHSLIHPYSFTHSLIHPYSFTHSLIHPYSCTHSPMLTCSFTHLPILTHSLLPPHHNQVYEKANSVVTEEVHAPRWLHRFIIGRKGQNVQMITKDLPKVLVAVHLLCSSIDRPPA